MANDLSAVVPKIISRAAMILYARLMFTRYVNTSYSNDAAEKGDTITIPIPSETTTEDVVPSNVLPAVSDSTINKALLELDQWKKSKPFKITDKEIAEIDASRDYLPPKIGEAIKALGRGVNQHIAAQVKGVYNWVGDASSVPFASNANVAVDARKILNTNLVPDDQRFGLVSIEAEANMLKLSEFSDASKVGDSDVKIRGQIGMKYGIDWAYDNDIPVHTTGATTGTAIAVDNGAGYSAGVKTIHIDGLTGDPIEGDLFTFAGHTQQYVVTSSTGTGAELDVNFEPALAADVADNEVLTFIGDHKKNVVMHRNAIGFASRRVRESANRSGNRVTQTVVDPRTMIAMRLEQIEQYKQTMWEFDALYGAELYRPELACLILEQA